MKIRRRKKKDKHRWPECEGDGRRFQTGQKMDQDICCISKRAIGWRERTSCKSNIWHDTIRLRDVQCSAALATWSAISHIHAHNRPEYVLGVGALTEGLDFIIRPLWPMAANFLMVYSVYVGTSTSEPIPYEKTKLQPCESRAEDVRTERQS